MKINFHNLKKAALVLRSLNHKLRQQILALIETEKRITVTEIYVRLRLEQSVASQHLAILILLRCCHPTDYIYVFLQMECQSILVFPNFQT